MADPDHGENRILKRLEADELLRLQPNLKKISMLRGTVLHAAGAPVEHVYFPTSGMVSILTLLSTGEQIETAIIGREGVAGASVASNGAQSPGKAVVQIAGAAWQIRAGRFMDVYKASKALRTLVNKFQIVLLDPDATRSASAPPQKSPRASPPARQGILPTIGTRSPMREEPSEPAAKPVEKPFEPTTPVKRAPVDEAAEKLPRLTWRGSGH